VLIIDKGKVWAGVGLSVDQEGVRENEMERLVKTLFRFIYRASRTRQSFQVINLHHSSDMKPIKVWNMSW